MPAAARPTPDDIDIVSLFGAIRRALRTLVIVTAVVGVSSYALLSSIASRFTSESQISIVAKRTNPFPADKGEAPRDIAPRLDKQAINTHVRSLVAPDLVRNVAGQLQLASRPEFNSALGSIDLYSRALRTVGIGAPAPGETAEERTLRAFYERLEVAAANESRFISIRFSSADPALAAEVANRLAATYRDSLVSTPVAETSDVVDALKPKVAQLRKELIATESEVERFRAVTDQFRSGPEKTPINDRRMQALTDELTKAEAAKSEAEARWTTARELARSGSADILPDVQKSPVVQNLINQKVAVEREYAQANAQLLPGHPRMRELAANLSSLKQQINVEVRKVVASLEKDFGAATARVENVTSQIDKLKTKVVATTGNEAKLRALESEARAKRAELERLQKQLEDNRTLVNIKQVPVEAQIVSMARASAIPTFPKKGPYTLLAMAATFLLGLAWIVFRELVSGAYGSRANRERPVKPAQSRKPAGEPVARPLGVGEGDTANRHPTMAEIASAISEREGATNGYRTLLVGTGDEAPSADFALDLAGQLAGRGQSVLVIDWTLTGEGALDAFAGADRRGMADLLREEATFEDVIHQLPGSAIHAIAPGAIGEEGTGLLDPVQLNLVLDVLDEAYDQIIVTAGYGEARHLFEAIEGRFDAAVRVGEKEGGFEAGTLLGHEVEGIRIFDYLPPRWQSGLSSDARPAMAGGATHRH